MPSARSVVSPFLPKPGLVTETLRYLGLPADKDAVYAETRAENYVAFVRTAREEAEKLA